MSRESFPMLAGESWSIRDGLSTVRIFRRTAVRDVDPSRELPPAEVCWKLETWLRLSPHTLRSLEEALGGGWPGGLTRLERLSHDQRLMNRLAEAFESGQLIAVLEERAAGHGRVEDDPIEELHEIWEPPPPPVKPAPAVSSTMDVAAQAQALRNAARDGVPFCEECEKRRQQQAAA
ncbi:hypothetical protein [Hyalangium versicolor]|uniref:hypothetical protein n=1 Tax=Hyalangium versicolor TaxID=2861190 RepID=UPI001CCF4F13|nr:hypothetical protein [Hyalangium versicolor]